MLIVLHHSAYFGICTFDLVTRTVLCFIDVDRSCSMYHMSYVRVSLLLLGIDAAYSRQMCPTEHGGEAWMLFACLSLMLTFTFRTCMHWPLSHLAMLQNTSYTSSPNDTSEKLMYNEPGTNLTQICNRKVLRV